MAIQNINELYDKLSANENFSEFNFGSADDFKLYLEELPEQKKEKFYNAWLEDEDISKDQFENLVKKKETGRTGILSSALGSIDFGSPSVSKSEPQAVVTETENVSGQMPIAPATTDVVGPQDIEMGIEDSSVSGVTGGPLASGPGPVKPTPVKKEEPLIKPASQLQGRTFDIGQADEQFAGQKKQIEEKGKEVAKEIAKKAAMLPAAREVIKPVQEQASLIKMLEDQNDFKRNEFVFETPSPQTEMDATGNVYRPMIKTAARPTDEQIGEILYNKERVLLSNPMDIGRWTGPTQHFDEETFEAYLKNKGLSPRNAKIVIQNYINKYLDSKVEDVDFKLSKVEGKTTAEKINKIREQENEYGLDLLTRQYGISVGDKARELQTYMANRKRPGEAGYEQWNKQLGILQKEMSGLVGGGQRLYNPEDGKLYDRASAPKRALVFKAYLDDAIKVYKNTDVDKLKELRSNLMDKVKFLEEDYDRKLGPQWRGKGWLKSLSGTMTDDQEEALKNSFATLDKYKAQLSAINSRLLTNTDIEPVTTDKTGQFAKQLKAALPGGDFQTQYRTLKDNYGAYVDAVDGVIQLKPEEIEKRELTVGEEAIGAIGSSIPIMVEIIASRSIAPAVEAIRASRYLRPITRGALKLTGNRKFANFVSDMVASAAHGYITYAPTSETGATGVGETLFSEGIYDKIGLKKLGAQWNPVFRYLSKVAFGTVGETAEEFVGEYTNALSETGFDFAQSAEETFGKNVSDFSKKLAVYAASSAVMSSAFNTPELFIKATRFDDVRKLAEEKLQNPNISQDEKETIESSLKMMDSTKQNLDQKEAEEPVNTIDIEASPTEVAAMETFEGAPETKPAAEVIPGEEGVGPVEGAAPKPSVETKGIEQLISPEIKSESIDNADENIEFEPNGYYELLDENGYPSVAYTDSETGRTEFETSEKPQISASKNIGGAITGLFSMLRNNKVNPRQKIAIYEITEKPSVEIPSDARVADFPFLSEVRYDNKVSGKKTKEINLTEKDIDFLNDFYDSFEMDSDQYDNLLKKYNAEDNNELDNIFKDKIFNLIKSEEGKYYRAVIVNKTKTEAVGPQKKTNLQEISTEVAQGGVTDVSLQKIEDYGKEIESGNVDFERFSPAEQRGLIEGGPIHVEATIITGKSDRGTDTQDESNDRQEEIVEEYAKKKGIWTENAHAKLNQQHGKPINSGQESIVWLDRKRGVVIKSSNTRNYTTLREALDSITLSNAYFPAAKITVIGFGTDAEGNFEIITEQPYIQGTEATEQEIKDYFNNLGFTENERLYVGKDAFGNEEVIFKDAAPKNVIKTPEGNIIPIDLIAKINKPELNANGTRTVPSTVAEEVSIEKPRGKKTLVQKLKSIFNPEYKNTIEERLSKFDERIKEKNFPTALEVAEEILPKNIFNKYKNLYELAARNNITVSNEPLPPNITAAWAFGNIQLNKNTAKYNIDNYQEFAETLNHEIIHGLINYGVRNNYGLFVELQNVIDSVVQNFEKANDEVKDIITYIQDTRKEFTAKDFENFKKDGTFPEIGDLEELITYAFTNTEFAKFLDSIPASKEINAEGNTIFDQLKNILRNIINTFVTEQTALDEINVVLNKYFDTAFQEQDIAERNEKYNWSKRFSANKNMFDEYNNDPDIIYEAYTKAKADNSNPELIKAVEELIGEEAAPEAVGPQAVPFEKSSGTTQVATTTGSYVKAANIFKGIKGDVLDYGAGLGLGTDAMSNTLGRKVDSFEPNPERWQGKEPATFTSSEQINKKYDAIVSLNVLNVVPKDIRDSIVKDIFDKLNIGGQAVISTRGWVGDVNAAKNAKPGPEEKSLIITRRQGGEVVEVFQKGFDGNELVDYVQGLLGDQATVVKNNTFGKSGIIITKKAEIGEGYGSQNTIVTKEDYDQAVKNLRNPNIASGFDFSKLGDLIKAGMYHIEAGSRSFANFSKKMIEQFGQAVKKYLPVVFRRSNTQLQQQAAAPGRTKAPKKAPRPTFDEVRKNIRKDRDDFVKANKTQSPSIIGQYLLSKGYTLGQIKTHLPEYNSYWQKKARELFMDYVKVHQNKIEQRRKEIADFMDKNPTLEYEDIYEQLKDKYSDFELFKAFYEDGASPSLLDETFGTEYRQTIQNLIDSKGYNPDFLRDMDEDIRSRKVEKNLGEARSVYADLQDFASAEELLDAAAEVLGISGVEEAMKTATDKVRAENKKKADILKAYGKVMKGDFKPEDAELIKNISDILSFSGRMLRMGRGLFMTEKGLADLIIRNLSNITYKKDSNFAKTKKAFRVPEKTQQKIRELVKKYFETKAKLDEAIAQVEDGANAFTDEAFDEFNKARAEHQKASTELKGLVNRLYGSRAPLISRWFTSMTSMALLSFRTIFVGLIGNMEMMLASMPRKTWVGKLLGWTRILANFIVGLPIRFKKGQGLAYEATKRGTGVGIDPSIYRKLAFQQGKQQIKDILRKGLTEQTSSERDFLQGYAEIDGVKDFQLGFKMISKMIKNIAGKEKMTDEEFGAAFDKMLIALEEKDASGNPKLAGMHSKGYYAATALLRGFFGSIPTITGRAIALSGDRVFYQYGYYEFLAAYANSKGITDPAEVKRFIALNSVGDSDAARAAERAANKRIFAQNNAIVRFFGTTKAKLDQLEQNIYGAKIKKKVQGKGIQAAVTGVGAYPIVAAKIALNAFSPFVTIPSNVVSKYLRVGVPVFPLVMAVRTQMQLNSRMNEYQKNYSLKDNAEMSETTKKKMEADRVALFEQQRLAAQYWTEFFQGAQLAGLAMLLIQTGAVGAPYGDDDESKKRARAAGIAQQDAGKLNLSHLFDVVTGKETRGRVAKKGDITIDYRNLGMAGFSISTWASADAYLKTQQLKNKKLMGADEDVIGMVNAHLITESLKNGVTQLGFIQNISNFISGIKSDKGAEALASSLLTTVLTVPTLSYGVLSPFERIEGIGSDPLRGYHPDLESSDVFMGEVGARVWTKLTARSPLFGFGLRKEDGTFAAPLKTLGFTPSEFYRPQIGPHGERLYKKSTFWDTRSGSMADKFLAFAQASIDPVNMSDYEGFVSQVKPFDMKKEYRKGDFIEWNNNIWVVTKDKIKGLSPKDAQLGEDKDYILLDTKKNFLDPDRWRRDKEGTRKTQLLFDFVNEYEKATGDRKEYGLFSKLYTDPVKFKDEDGEFAVYIPMEEQRKLSILRGEAMARSWDSDEVQNRLDIIQKTAEDENISDADWKNSTKELFLDYMKGAMDENQNRSGGLIDRVNEAIKGVEESPEYAAIVRDGIVRSVKEGLLTEAEFDRLAKHTVAGNFIASMDKSKLKFRK